MSGTPDDNFFLGGRPRLFVLEFDLLVLLYGSGGGFDSSDMLQFSITS